MQLAFAAGGHTHPNRHWRAGACTSNRRSLTAVAAPKHQTPILLFSRPLVQPPAFGHGGARGGGDGVQRHPGKRGCLQVPHPCSSGLDAPRPIPCRLAAFPHPSSLLAATAPGPTPPPLPHDRPCPLAFPSPQPQPLACRTRRSTTDGPCTNMSSSAADPPCGLQEAAGWEGGCVPAGQDHWGQPVAASHVIHDVNGNDHSM